MTTIRKPWTWNEIDHWTVEDLLETLQLLSEQDEADDFMSAYAEVCHDEDHAEHNLRYLLQLLMRRDIDVDEISELLDLDKPTLDEVFISRNWFANSSCGIKVEFGKAEVEVEV